MSLGQDFIDCKCSCKIPAKNNLIQCLQRQVLSKFYSDIHDVKMQLNKAKKNSTMYIQEQ